jgi:CDGSH-type Zn-finger protein
MISLPRFKAAGAGNMSKPTIAANTPIRVTLEADRKYFFCMCGKSSKQPFCDGSHKDSGISPMPFEVSESKDYFLCRCKQSANKPYCDGSHKAIDDDQVGQTAP